MNKKISILIFTMFLLIINSVLAGVEEEDEWWTFNDVFTSNSGGVDLEITAGDPSFVAGKLGKSVDFDGNDELRNASGMTPLTTVSFTGWIKIGSVSATQYIFIILDSGSVKYYLNIGGADALRISCGGVGDYTIDSAADILNTWTHIAGFWNTSNVVWWLNGTQGSSVSTNCANAERTGGILLGRGTDGINTYTGEIDQLMIYRDELINQTQVTASYNSGHGTNASQFPDTTPAGLKSSDSAGCPSCVPYQNLLNQPWKPGGDVTPTVNATMNESATCAIIGAETTAPNYNYTDAISNGGIECSTTGSTNQICTIQSSNAFNISEDNYICVGCKDGNSNEFSNATFCASVNITAPPPAVNLIIPENNSYFKIGTNASNIQFSFNITSYFRNASCNLTINNLEVYYNTTVHNSTNTIYIHNSLSVGLDQNWNVSCIDANGNTNSSRRYFTVEQFANVTLLLNGLSQNRKYEFGTVTNLTANCSSTTGTTCPVCINLTAPYYGNNYSCGENSTSFIYNITTLRQTNFTRVSTLSSSDGINISMDNRTELIRTYLNITSSGTSTNLNISYYGQHKNYTGDLKTIYLKQTEFIHLGAYKDAVNLTYLTGASNYIYIDIPINVNNLTFELTGSELDAENEFNYDEHFNTSAKINHTLSQADAPLGYFDDFESNVSGRWDIEIDESEGGVVVSYRSDGNDAYLSAGSSIGQSASGDRYGKVTITTEDEGSDFRNSSIIENNVGYSVSASCGGGCDHTGSSGSGTVVFYITDGTNNVILKTYFISCSAVGCSSNSNQLYNYTFIKDSDDYKSWKFYINGSLDSTKNLEDLDFTKVINLKYDISTAQYGSGSGCPCGGSASIANYNYKVSGAWLNMSTTLGNGTYNLKGNFTSKVLNVTKTNISRILVNWYAYEPDNTKVNGYASNNCGNTAPTFENIQSGLMHVFTTQDTESNKPCVRFELNSSDNYTSPIVRTYELDIIPSAITNITVDLEDNGIIDWSWLDELNSSNSPKVVNFTSIPTGDDITIKISSATSGIVQVDNFNLNNTLNPIKLNHTYFEDCYNCTIDFGFSGNSITVSGLEFDFYGSWNYTATAWYSDMTDEHKIQIYYSDFNITYPEGYEWYDISGAQNASNVTPYGQTSSTPIWNITRLAYDEDINIYIKTNETIAGCLNITLSNNTKKEVNIVNETFGFQNNTAIQLANKDILNETVIVFNQTDGIGIGSNNYTINSADGTINLTTGYGDRETFGINYTYLTYGYDYANDFTFKLNTSYQQIIANISASKGIWSWENYYSCGWGLNWSWFYFASICEDCYFDEPQLDYYNIIVE